MSGSVDDVPCMNFEANIFAKSLCQHCFRAAGAHQHAVQDDGTEVTGRDACSDAAPGEPWDSLHILAPQCEVYVCVGPAEGTERSPPKTCFAVDVVASRVARASPSNGLLPVPERRPASQKPEESWPKHRKTDPPWASTLPRGPAGSPPARSDLLGASGPLSGPRLRECHGHGGGAEARHGLERQEYTVLADLPKPKRLGQRDAADRCGSRTLSPGRVEVERIFGCERRKSETLEAFQALEEGRVERLDGKTPVPPSKGHLTRRRSSPNLPREAQRLSWQLEQRSRDPKEPRRSPSPARHPEKAGRTRGDSPRPASPGWLLERGSRSPRSASPARRPERRAGEPVNPPCRTERSWRSRGEPARPPNSERGRGTWQAGGVRQALEKKSRGDSLQPTGAGKGSDNVRLSRAGPPPRALSPGRRAESTRKSQKEISPPSLVRGAERQRVKPGEPLHLAGPRKPSECSWQSLREKLTSSQPAKGTSSDWKGRGKPLRPTSPTRPLEQDWRGRGDAHQAQVWEKDWKRQEMPVCHADVMRQLERDWKNPARCLDVGLRPDDSWKRPESPVQHLEEDWKGPEHARDTHSPEKPLETDWGKKSLLMYHPQLGGSTFPPQSSTGSSGSPQPHLNASKKRNKPDLLNFKKGWMSILDEPGEWKKHWFVLTDSSLRYYRDSNAEEADDLDGEIDLRSCTDVTEFAVQRNYGFQIHTKDAVFTLSAMTSGIRRNWIEALRKNVRPVSAPDVTKLPDCDKENFRNCVPQKGSLRAEEQPRPGSGSEGSSKGSHWKAEGQRHAFDYVELSPLPQDPGSQGSLQRTKGSLKVCDRTARHEELERDLAMRSEERRKWFETPDGRVPNSDGPAGDPAHKAGEQDLPTPPLSEDQRIRLNEEIEKKWLELEHLPLKDLRRVPLTTLLNQSKGGQGDTNEALKKEIQSLRAQLESCRARNESLREAAKSQGDSHVPRGYISQEACERSLAEMESSHQQVMEELQRHHQRELERLRQEKERLLAEEAAATAAAIEALKKAHREEMNKELGRTRSFQQCSSLPEALQKQHQLDVESLKRELQVLSEQYSQKCLEIGELTQKAEEREQMLERCQQEGKDLLQKNQELQTRLSDEIGKLRSFISSRGSGDRASHNNERSSCELEVLLRVKENELQYVKKEVQCLREELQMMQKDKRFASGKYQDVYAELNHIKVRSEREIEQLKEHLRLAMAALQEKESLCNSK
ncbi:TRIO and F-actin-binding protein isoform X1 [Passer domesticus]|uniref:TRIO and F-actin-binding protein isoform X1 n=1 Tax=Passer domesticus TaxID=48849 RepID=UPI0030FE4181